MSWTSWLNIYKGASWWFRGAPKSVLSLTTKMVWHLLIIDAVMFTSTLLVLCGLMTGCQFIGLSLQCLNIWILIMGSTSVQETTSDDFSSCPSIICLQMNCCFFCTTCAMVVSSFALYFKSTALNVKMHVYLCTCVLTYLPCNLVMLQHCCVCTSPKAVVQFNWDSENW